MFTYNGRPVDFCINYQLIPSTFRESRVPGDSTVFADDHNQELVESKMWPCPLVLY